MTLKSLNHILESESFTEEQLARLNTCYEEGMKVMKQNNTAMSDGAAKKVIWATDGRVSVEELRKIASNQV